MSKPYNWRARIKPTNPNWRQENITSAQVWKLKQLGYSEFECLQMTKGEASSAITAITFGTGDKYENVKPPMCNVLPEDVAILFGHAENGKRFPYLSEEDWRKAG